MGEESVVGGPRKRSALRPGPTPSSGQVQDETRIEGWEQARATPVGERSPPYPTMNVGGPPNPAPGATRSARVLLLFAGSRRPGSMAEAWRALGYRADDVDVLIGGRLHDVSRTEVQCAILAAIRAGCYEVVWIGTPCSSFSVLHLERGRPRLRSRQEPEGVRGMPQQWRRYVRN